MKAIVHSLLLGAGLAWIAGCASSNAIDGKDDEVIFPAVRVTWDLVRPEKSGLFGVGESTGEGAASPDGTAADAKKEKSKPGPPRKVDGSFAFDFDFAYGGGESSQITEAGSRFHTGSIDVVGPVEVDHDYGLSTWSFVARGGFWVDDFYGFEGLGGLVIEHLDIEASSGGIKVDDQEIYVGPIVGAQFSVVPISWCTIYARGTIAFGFVEDLFSHGSAETAISFAPHERIALFGGWRWWDIEVDRDSEVDIDLELSGPTFGLQINL